MNGSTQEQEVETLLAFYFEYFECVYVSFLPFRFICNCGHHFQCMVFRFSQEKFYVFGKALVSAHSKNVVCECLGIAFISTSFLS